MSENLNVLGPGRPPGVELMKKLGMAPDPWQVEVLESHSRRILLNCSRQAGKSTVVAMFSLVEALVKEPRRWMDAPNDQLGGEKPRDLIGTNREQRLRDLLRAIRYGIPT